MWVEEQDLWVIEHHVEQLKEAVLKEAKRRELFMAAMYATMELHLIECGPCTRGDEQMLEHIVSEKLERYNFIIDIRDAATRQRNAHPILTDDPASRSWGIRTEMYVGSWKTFLGLMQQLNF